MAVAMRSPFWVSLTRCSAAAPSAAAGKLNSNYFFSNTKLGGGSSPLLHIQGANLVEFGLGRFCSVSSITRRENSKLVTRASVKADVDEQKGVNGVRVRFAPSPTGNLHVGGARTALFNYLFAKSTGGKFILRVEDTDLERSTRQSEEAVIRDIKWLGLDWDEGPDIGGDYGPYRQSERNEIYQHYVEKLLKSGSVYRCFCSDEELEAMREECKAKNLPPKYMGKWGGATDAEIEAELAKGTPFTYRFRVPQEGSVTINDLIRGEVTWNQDTLGDFVVLRSNGQPVYNFCVAVDDVTMKITHVIRAEEHLPNTLRQALIYKALGFSMPQFGHVSLILAPDRSKLSKRHGATSVGQFKEMGYLPAAMVNYLALLGWNDGSEEEIFTVQQLIEKFTIDRITKSAAIFDLVKLGWMNGQHLRALPVEDVSKMFGQQWLRAGLVSQSEGPFIDGGAALLQNGTDIVSDSEEALTQLLGYPLHMTLASEQVKEFMDDNLQEVAKAVLAAYDSGDLQTAIDGGHDTWKKWVNSVGKALKRKGKKLFMPIRIVLTGRMQGPDIGSTLALLKEGQSSGVVTVEAGLIPLPQRIETLRAVDWLAVSQQLSNAAEGSAVLAH